MSAPPLAFRVLPKRVFYGWYLAVACSVVMFVGVGVGYYALAVFLGPLQDARGFSGAEVSAASGLNFALAGITGAIVGPAIDRRGPKLFIVGGTIVLAAAVALIGQVTTSWQLFGAYALLAVGFGVSTSVSVSALMTRWFVVKRAKATSISSTGISVGGVVLSPLCGWLVEEHGLGLASGLLGAMIAVVAVPVALAMVVTDPADLGLEPDGGASAADSNSALSAVSQRRAWSRREAMRTVSLWAIVAAFALVLVDQTGFILHQVSFLQERLGSRSAATLALSTTALGSIVARLVVGQVADGLSLRRLAAVLFCVQALSVVGCLLVEGRALTYAFTLLFGFTIGNVYMVQGLLVGEVFGMVSFATIFGLVGLTSQVMSGAGPILVGVVEEATGGYDTPFLLTAGMTAFAAVVVQLARPVAPDAASAMDQGR